MAYNFAAFVALAPETGELARNTRGQVFAADDGALTSPLTVTIDGIEVTEIPVGPQGVGTPFTSDEPIVLFKSSGAPPISLASLQHLADAAVAAADDAELSRIAAELAAANAAEPTDEAIREALATAIADPESGVSGAIDTEVADQLAGRLPITPEQFGAVGDGVADDTAALQDALDAGPVVQLTAGKTYATSSTLTPPAGVWIVGRPGSPATIAAASSLSRVVWLQGAGSGLADVIVDGADHASSDVIRIAETATDAVVRNVTVKASVSGAAFIGLNVMGPGAVVNGCTFDGPSTGIRILNGPSDVTITNNRVKNWIQRGIYVAGTVDDRCDRVRIIGNTVTDLQPGGTSRYPIRIEGHDSNPHQDVIVARNYVRGPGTGYHNPTTPGTADQISLVKCDGLIVSDNISVDGGDAGMTISLQGRNVTVTGNLIRRADAVGLYLGSNETISFSRVTVTGNTIVDCGQNREGDRAAPSGIKCLNATDIHIEANVVGNDQGTTQPVGIVVEDTCSGITVGANTDAGNTVALLQVEPGAGVALNLPPVQAWKASDTVRNNTGTLQSDPHLSVPVEPNAVYEVEARVFYRATVDADAKFGWGSPAGCTMPWSAIGLAKNATSGNGQVNTAPTTVNGSLSLGGAGAPKATAVLSGLLQTGLNGGNMVLQWSQDTAEASDLEVFTHSSVKLTRVA